MLPDPKKILIVLHGSIGDVTRALPLANLIHRKFPRAVLAWAVEPAAAPLVNNHPAVDEVIVFERGRWFWTLLPFLRRIRAYRFDLVLDLQRHFKSGIVSRISGAKVRLGFHPRDAKECNWIFNNDFIEATGDKVSKLAHYLKFAEHLGITPQTLEWGVSLSALEEAAVNKLIPGLGSRFAVLFAGSRWESKRWFPDQLENCAEEIYRRFGLSAVILGGKDDEAFVGNSERLHETFVLNLVGRTSLREAIGVVRRARVAIGPDTGLMHIAAAVGTPVVSLWGATSVARTGPFGFEDLAVQGNASCAPCYVKRCPIGRVCMRSINIDHIIAMVGLALSRERKDGQKYG